MAEQYTIKPEKFKELRKQLLIKALPRLIILIIAAYAIAYFNLMDDSDSESSGIIVMIIPIVTISILIGVIIGFSRQKKGFKSFKVTITESEVRREMESVPTIRIRLEDIQSISKDKLGNFIIKGKDKSDIIGISSQVTGYGQLEQSLMQIREIEIKNQTSYDKILEIAAPIAMLAGMFIVYYLNNKWIVGISGTLVSAFMIWSFLKIQKSKNVSNGTRIRSYFMILVLLSIIVTTYIKLTK